MEQKRASPRSERLQSREQKEKLKAPHEDDVRAALTTLGYNRALVSIGLSAAATLPAEADRDARLRVALTALTRGLARKDTPSEREPARRDALAHATTAHPPSGPLPTHH